MAKRNTNPKIEDADYEVGYGKPPQHTRFPKGRSGNPRGRPKRKRRLCDRIFKELDKKIQVTENGRPLTMTKADGISKLVVNLALQGNAQAIKLLMQIQDSKPDDPDDKFVFIVEGENDP